MSLNDTDCGNFFICQSSSALLHTLTSNQVKNQSNVSVAVILNCSWQLGHVYVISFRPT